MGQRYEKSKKNVSDNKQTLERLRSDKDTLHNEYSPLSLLDSIRGLLDDEASDAIQGVRAAGEFESQRIKSETDTAEKEKNQITGEINNEIAKLSVGLEKLRRSGNIEFGKRAAEQSSREYQKQIDKFKRLIGELGEHVSDAGIADAGAAEGTNGRISDSIGETPTPLNEGENAYIQHMKPDRSTPRDLPQTQYGYTKDANGLFTYDSPQEMGQYLYAEQGSAYTNFQGTCGLCSCANILRLSGVNYGEKDMIDYAANAPSNDGWFEKLCAVNPFSAEKSGGTTPKQRKAILDHFGINSSVIPVRQDADGNTSIDAINDLGKYVSEGRGVIIDVDAGAFYDEPRMNGFGHAVTVTSVTKNSYGDVSGFYILDSNRGTVYYSARQIQEAIRPFVGLNVTNQIIR
ncbi:MAG: hypothetical protein NC409_10165 [Clostridium sp.]|nr:hypothetical protein [Clostridium sp.]